VECGGVGLDGDDLDECNERLCSSTIERTATKERRTRTTSTKKRNEKRKKADYAGCS
jgi:hypothetical protein